MGETNIEKTRSQKKRAWRGSHWLVNVSLSGTSPVDVEFPVADKQPDGEDDGERDESRPPVYDEHDRQT